MATKTQSQAARKNVRKAAEAATAKESIASVPEATRTALGQQGAAVAQRKQSHDSSPKTRSKMGRDELARALGHK